MYPVQPRLDFKLDAKDRQIIYEFERDSRRSLAELAHVIKISKQTLHYRIERLIENKVILGFVTVIDVAKLGYVNHEVWFQLTEKPLEKRKIFIDFLISNPNIRWVASCGGKFDLGIGILAKNIVHFNSILRSIIRAFPTSIKNYHVAVSLELHSYPRSYLLHNEQKRKLNVKENTREHAFFGGEPTDSIGADDRKILTYLANNARIGTTELAKKANLDPNTIRARIKKLEKSGVIQRYSAFHQASRFGVRNYELLFSMQNLDENREREIESFCLANEHVTFLLKIIGKWDINIALEAYNENQLQEFIIDFRTRFSDCIKDFEIISVFETHKFTYLP